MGVWRILRELNELSSATDIDIDLDAIEQSSQGAGLLTQRTTLLVETIVVSPSLLSTIQNMNKSARSSKLQTKNSDFGHKI